MAITNINQIEEIKRATLSFGADEITGTRFGKVSYEDLFSAVDILMGTTLVEGDDAECVEGDVWPGIPELVVDTIQADALGATITSDWETGPKFDFAELTVGYKTKPFDEGEDADLLIQQLDYSVEVLVVPLKISLKGDPEGEGPDPGFVEFGPDGGPPPKGTNERTVKRHIRLPTITYTMTLPRVRNPNFAALNEKIGKISSDFVLGAPAGQILFDGVNADRTLTFRKRSWKVALKMIFNRHGWNNSIDPRTLLFRPIVAKFGDQKPYELTAMASLLEMQRRLGADVRLGAGVPIVAKE